MANSQLLNFNTWSGFSVKYPYSNEIDHYVSVSNSPTKKPSSYKFSLGGHLAKDWVLGYAYDKFQSTANITIGVRTVFAVGGNKHEIANESTNYALKHQLSTHTLFMRKILVYGLFTQLGLTFRDWRESLEGFYAIKWPTVALQFGFGGDWVDNGFGINAGWMLITVVSLNSHQH